MNDTVLLQARVPAELAEALRRKADAQYLSLSAALRLAMLAYVAEPRQHGADGRREAATTP